MNARHLALAAAVALAACAHAPTHTAVAPTERDTVSRIDFNRIAADLALPIFWVSDANGDGAMEPDELAVYGGLDPAATRDQYVKDGAFTPAFLKAQQSIAAWSHHPWFPGNADAKELERRKLSIKELEQSRPTLVQSDLRKLAPAEKEFVQALLDAGEVIERLYQKQLGVWDLRARVPADDAASRTVFYRNQSYRCVAPQTAHELACSAIPNPPAGKVSGLYPEAPLQAPDFCDWLSKQGPELQSPFTVIRQGADKKFSAAPYTEAFKDDMTKVSELLTRAADALPAGTEEPLRAYLRADAKAFLTNDWVPADEAWARMNAQNSKWYLRLAPDETYDEPCSMHALFQVSFGLIDPGSLHWQSVLTPLQNQMEAEVAKLAGPPYQARKVSFHLPDFFQVVLNAGDARSPTGATIGESLPNFGPVANEGRGRTVAMTNFYTDPDSLAALRQNAESLLCPATMAHFTPSTDPGLMSTVLHEATHNLGPAAQYAVGGKIDNAIFGGPLASILEELKAQSGALHFADWLAEKKLISTELAGQAHVRDLLWQFGHISRGMFDAEHHANTYSQLAAMQLGFLMRAGAAKFMPEARAANGTDTGCFELDLAKYPAADAAMFAQIAGIKGRGDRAAAEAWLAQDVNVSGDRAALRKLITERILRTPKATFVYDVELK